MKRLSRRARYPRVLAYLVLALLWIAAALGFTIIHLSPFGLKKTLDVIPTGKIERPVNLD